MQDPKQDPYPDPDLDPGKKQIDSYFGQLLNNGSNTSFDKNMF
jgi:hypothetical protein